jgi:hypothetical protein
MNILYFPVHEVLEFDDLRLLTGLGHAVFSTGPYGSPRPDTVLRSARAEFFSPEHHAAYGKSVHSITNGVVTLDPRFVDRFDTIIVNHDPRLIEANAPAFAGKPVIWRTLGQARRLSERMAWKAGRNLFVVRYSRREAALPQFIPTDATIYFGKYEEDFEPWAGRGGPVLTFFNGIERGDAIPAPKDYLAIVDGFDTVLCGRGNDGLPTAKGIVAPDAQRDLFRSCGVYLYVHSQLGCYSLNFVEALMSGTPILAPSAKFVSRTIGGRDPNWHPLRYEVDELLADGAGLVYDSVEEARTLLRAVLRGEIDALAVSSRARERAIQIFSARIIRPQWAEVLARVIAAPRFGAVRHATRLGLYVATAKRAVGTLLGGRL